MKDIKTIVFDLGGVVVHLERQVAVDRFVAMGITDANDMLNAYHQHGIFLEVEDGSITGEEFCAKIRNLTGIDHSYETIAQGWLGFIKETPQYKLDYIRALREHYNVYLLSNTNPFVMEWARSNAFSTEGKPLTYYFDKLYASCELKVVKPHHEIFEKMIADSGLIPSETLFLDDGAANIKAGQELGFHTYQPVDGEDWRAEVDKILGR